MVLHQQRSQLANTTKSYVNTFYLKTVKHMWQLWLDINVWDNIIVTNLKENSMSIYSSHEYTYIYYVMEIKQITFGL